MFYTQYTLKAEGRLCFDTRRLDVNILFPRRHYKQLCPLNKVPLMLGKLLAQCAGDTKYRRVSLNVYLFKVTGGCWENYFCVLFYYISFYIMCLCMCVYMVCVRVLCVGMYGV
jgi:hypothetical protein